MRVNQCAGPGCRILGVAEREMDQVLIHDDDEYKRNTAWVSAAAPGGSVSPPQGPAVCVSSDPGERPRSNS